MAYQVPVPEKNPHQLPELGDYSNTIISILSKNIRLMLKRYGWSQTDLCNKIENNGIYTTQSIISKYLPKNTETKYMSLGLVLQCCKLFHISFEDLASPFFDPDEFAINLCQDNNTSTILPESLKSVAASITKSTCFPDALAAAIASMNKDFIVDGKDDVFNGYYQRYCCYMYPTQSKKSDLLTGELEFRLDNGLCRAFLNLDIGKKDSLGNPIHKHYEGLLIIAGKIQSCYCILSSIEDENINVDELCFLIFRYIHINSRHRHLECRMAEALTASSGGDSTYPTIHRMFFSREPLKGDSLDLVSPHLLLNNSVITIEDSALWKVARMSTEYENIIRQIVAVSSACDLNILPDSGEVPNPIGYFSLPDSEEIPNKKTIRRTMYIFKEDLAHTTAEILLSKEKVNVFISHLRSHSYAFRYNKVSKKLDDNVRKLLMEIGYFREK